MSGGGSGSVVDDAELVVGELRTVTAEDQGLGSVGREHHHSRSVANGNRRYERTHIRLSVDDIYARGPSTGGDAIGDERAVFGTAGLRAAGGSASAAQ